MTGYPKLKNVVVVRKWMHDDELQRWLMDRIVKGRFGFKDAGPPMICDTGCSALSEMSVRVKRRENSSAYSSTVCEPWHRLYSLLYVVLS